MLSARDDQLSAPFPLLIGANAAARLVSISPASWWRFHSAGKVPAPTRLGHRTLWRVAELRAWIGAGCPDRARWEALQAGTKGKVAS